MVYSNGAGKFSCIIGIDRMANCQSGNETACCSKLENSLAHNHTVPVSPAVPNDPARFPGNAGKTRGSWTGTSYPHRLPRRFAMRFVAAIYLKDTLSTASA